VTFVIAGVASMGLPGFSGFVAEFQVLIGAWQAYPAAAVLCGVGIVLGVAYTLRAWLKAFYPDTAPAAGTSHGHDDHPLEPITIPERVGAVLLIAATLVIGLCPTLLMDWIEPCLKSPMFARLLAK